jgi:2',3'-cyclic-nucleotide 2'-phosphodiesterase (5'-nucleotidase family)
MRESSEADIAFLSAASIDPALGRGPVRAIDLMNVYPSGDVVAVYKVRGRDLIALMEAMPFRPAPGILFSGVEVAYHLSDEGGGRMMTMTVNEQEVKPDRVYGVAVESEAKLKGGPIAALVRGDSPVRRTGAVRDLLAGHLATARVVRGSLDGRLKWVSP